MLARKKLICIDTCPAPSCCCTGKHILLHVTWTSISGHRFCIYSASWC
jgi:hypothetical protein